LPLQPRITTYLGIFFVALATLMYEILLTRIFSVTMLYHFAFVALSVAMFGLTAGALVVYLAPRLFTPEKLHHRLAITAVALPIVIVASFLIEIRIPFRVSTSSADVVAMALTYLVVAVPFVVSGVAICLILTRYPSSIGRLYAADLAGAALGCVLLIGVLGWSDGPTAVLWVAWLASMGGVALAVEAQSATIRRVAVAATVLLCLAAAGHTIMVRRGGGVIRLVYSKGMAETRPLYEKWNSYSRVRVTGDPEREGPAQGWGLSSTVPPTRLQSTHYRLSEGPHYESTA